MHIMGLLVVSSLIFCSELVAAQKRCDEKVFSYDIETDDWYKKHAPRLELVQEQIEECVKKGNVKLAIELLNGHYYYKSEFDQIDIGRRLLQKIYERELNMDTIYLPDSENPLKQLIDYFSNESLTILFAEKLRESRNFEREMIAAQQELKITKLMLHALETQVTNNSRINESTGMH